MRLLAAFEEQLPIKQAVFQLNVFVLTSFAKGNIIDGWPLFEIQQKKR